MASAGNCTAFLDPSKYKSNYAWGNCPQCVEPNADIAGIGVIVGIVGQAFLLIVAVFGWWIVNVPMRWKWVPDIFNLETASKSALSWADLRKDEIRKVLLISSDTQVVTGLALTIAGIIQFRANPPMSTYHVCIISNLLSISANGQAAMLFYAFRPEDTQSSEERHFPWKEFTPRIVISLTYIGNFLAWSALVYERFTSPVEGRDCLIDLPPQNGNYGDWSIFEAILMLFLVILAIFQGRLRSIGLRVHPPWRCFFRFLYDSFLPIFIVVYFLWTLVDIVALKLGNKDFMTDNTESHIEAFGQVVPIVLLLLPGLSLWDVFTKDVGPLQPRTSDPLQIDLAPTPLSNTKTGMRHASTAPI